MKEFNIEFRGRTKVKARNREEAEIKVEEKRNLKTITGVSCRKLSEVIAEGVIVNIGAMLTMLILLSFVTSMTTILKEIQSITNPGIKVIGLLIWLVILMSGAKIPEIVERVRRRYL